MIENRLIVCIANSWDYDPTSKHQIAKILARHNDIVWVNYHGSRRPTISRVDIAGAASALRRVARGMQRVSPSFVQVTPMVIPGATRPMLKKLHEAMLVAQIRRAIGKADRGRSLPVQVWSFAPDVPYLVGKFGEECFLYYCVDEYRQFKGFDNQRIAEAEDALIDRADLVVATSEPLLQARRRRRGDTVLVRHGVDYDHFASAWRSELPVPVDLAGIPKPVFGFFGLIEHWIDCDFLAQVARKRPWYSFVLLGDAKVDVSVLRDLPNVHLLGRKPYQELPRYCAHFDAAMLLFAQNAMTRHVNPVKMREYLAAGLPVISTPLPEASRYAARITVAETPEGFAGACDRVLQTDYDGRAMDISRSVVHETWQKRVEDLSPIVMGVIRRRRGGACKPAAEVLVERRRTKTVASSDARLVATDEVI